MSIILATSLLLPPVTSELSERPSPAIASVDNVSTPAAGPVAVIAVVATAASPPATDEMLPLANPTAAAPTPLSEQPPAPLAIPLATAPPTISANDPRVLDLLSGFVMPIRGARLSYLDTHLPGAPRPYRQGVHEGIDFFDSYVGVPISFGTEVVAAQDGIVVRADHEYMEVTAAEMRQLLARASLIGQTPPDVHDRLQGRQVILDHGQGIRTVYSHLDTVAPELQPGSAVRRGQVIGTVGNSGTEEVAAGLRSGPHLHFEILIDGRYLGWGLPVPEVRRWLELIFEQD